MSPWKEFRAPADSRLKPLPPGVWRCLPPGLGDASHQGLAMPCGSGFRRGSTEPPLRRRGRFHVSMQTALWEIPWLHANSLLEILWLDIGPLWERLQPRIRRLPAPVPREIPCLHANPLWERLQPRIDRTPTPAPQEIPWLHISPLWERLQPRIGRLPTPVPRGIPWLHANPLWAPLQPRIDRIPAQVPPANPWLPANPPWARL